MARMIPSFVDERTPPGERDVFTMLAAGPDDWVAMHSLDLAPWNRGLRTEIDFVVIVPDIGILCIEVKSHENITFDGDRWYPPEIKRSPFKQAADGRFTFYRRMRILTPRFACVPIVHCCIFPRATFDLMPNLSVAPWELMDIRGFRALNSSEAFCADLKTRLNRSIEADANLHPLSDALSPIDVASMVEACVPVQKRRPDVRQEVLRREEQAASILREQQKPVLRLAELNDRLIVTGGAGTGKTLIAIEVARRAAERGRRVALLCYNQLVGDWMRQRIAQTGPIPPNLVIGRAIRVMAEMTGVVIPEAPSPAFWETDLPQQLEDRLTDPDLKATSAFDYLVLDEAQDLLARPRLWHCLAQFLRGGIDGGMFALLGDFEHQVLKDHEPMQVELAAIDASARPVRWHLSENCRNYRIVGETALRLGGVPASVYSGYLRVGGGLQNYNIIFYESSEEQLAQLGQWLRDFKGLGYKASEITLLSFRSDESSAAVSLKHAGYKLRPAWQSGEGTAYASVHAFKGMENKIIILTDVVLTDQALNRDVFYTGMTRATECIRVLCDKKSEAVLCEWLTGKAER
jgi:hypothetical protein